jgi:hypothetical protein
MQAQPGALDAEQMQAASALNLDALWAEGALEAGRFLWLGWGIAQTRQWGWVWRQAGAL